MIPNDSGSISACFDDDPKLLNCETDQPHYRGGDRLPPRGPRPRVKLLSWLLADEAERTGIGLPVRMSARFYIGKPESRPSGRPTAGRRADFEALPTKILAENLARKPELRLGGTIAYHTVISLTAPMIDSVIKL